eukprot:jgi/Tetstr1/440421/TSEL_028755.t1
MPIARPPRGRAAVVVVGVGVQSRSPPRPAGPLPARRRIRCARRPRPTEGALGGCGWPLSKPGVRWDHSAGRSARRHDERGHLQASYQSALDSGSFDSRAGSEAEAAGSSSGSSGGGDVTDARPSSDEDMAAIGSALPELNFEFHKRHVQPPSIGSRITYLFQKVLVGPFKVRALVLLVFSLTSGGLAGLLMKMVEGGSLREASWQAFCILHDCPGADMMVVGSHTGRLLMMVLFYAGVFILAVFLGVMADEVRTRIDRVKDSNLRVLEGNHNVIVGWSRLTIPMLQQAEALAADMSNSIWRRPIVMLLRNAEERELAAEEIASNMPHTKLQVILRTGQPTKMSDLERVRAGQADTIIYLDPDTVVDYREFSVYKAAATLALVALRLSQAAKGAQTFVMQAANHNNNLFRRAQQEYALCHGRMIGVSRLNVALGSLVGVCALQPGLGGVFSDLIQVQPGSSGMVYIREMPELVGRQHRQIWRAFTDAVVTGYLHQPREGGETCDLSFTLSNGRAFETGGRLVLNPEEEYVMQPGDRLVVVSPSDQRVTEHLPAAAPRADADICVSGDLLLNTADVAPSGSDIVLICCENILKTVLESIAEFSLQKPTITIVQEPGISLGDMDLNDTVKDCRERGISVSVITGDWGEEALLVEAGVATCSSIVLGNKFRDDNDEEHDLDAQLMSQLLLIKRIREEAHLYTATRDPAGCGDGRPLHVVGLSAYKDTQVLADVVSMSTVVPITVDLLNLDWLMSGWITQVATQPEVAFFFREILSTSIGCEIYVRPAAGYFPTPALDDGTEAISFRAVQENARAKSETAIGFIQMATRNVVLGARTTASVGVQDRVVVVAED